MEHDPRYIALLILTENSQTRRPLDTILDQFSPQLATLSKLDRSLANAIVYGTLRWQAYLDWVIQPFSDRKLETLKTEIIYILRIAIFQIAFMDKIPVSAAVNSAVNLAKKISHQGVAGFVNAVLRKASINFSSVSLPDSKSNPDSYISVTQSMPLWLVKKWIAQYGFDKTLKLCDTINTIPPITIRTNTLKIDRESLVSLYSSDVDNIAKTNYSLHGINFTKPSTPIHESEPFKKGYFQVQDEAAQLVTLMLNPLSGEKILDACAGLGGKTGHIAQLMENKGLVVACDIDSEKLASLEKEMNRLGIDIVKTLCKDILKTEIADVITNLPTFSDNNDSLSEKQPLPLFDRVLVDAPCSGMGVLRRNPDAKWKRDKKDIARLAIRQEKMLLSVADLVKNGGILLYAVCSCEKRENEDVVDNFLKQRPDFKKHSFVGNQALSYYLSSQLQFSNSAMVPDNGYFKTYPEHIEMDGFFAAIMKRNVS
ncbi:MAG: 16S rRNA (cytosine(967)-C(5))-methyltransferase RsmB [Desulfamplus sp.]|nr:16S rRNA (cytosine(967)-C(5))-methyltransferase RsmB [Desulfamplus sp.]